MARVVTSGLENDVSAAAEAYRVLRTVGFILRMAKRTAPDDQRFAWKLINFFAMIADQDVRSAALRFVKEQPEYEPLELDDEFSANGAAVAMDLLAAIVDHSDLRSWCDSDADDGFVDAICAGARIGIATPSYKYGDSGLAIQKFALLRLNAQRRLQKPNSILLMIDKVDAFIPFVMSGIGISCVGAAHSIWHIETAIARQVGSMFAALSQPDEMASNDYSQLCEKYLLDTFGSVVALRSNRSTLEYIACRMQCDVSEIAAIEKLYRHRNSRPSSVPAVIVTGRSSGVVELPQCFV